jgi:hypothetical protein
MISVIPEALMGRSYGWGWRPELDGLIFLDAARLNTLGFLVGHVTGKLVWKSSYCVKSTVSVEVDTMEDYGFTRVNYKTSSDIREEEELDYYIYMTTTPCNFGGMRWWLQCPIVGGNIRCGRRVRRLYKYGRYFGCRQCFNLCYSEQSENKRYRSSFFRLITDDNKSEELLATIKRQYYNGKPTRKMRRYLKLERSADAVMDAWIKVEGLK